MTFSRKLSIATVGAATILSALSVPVSAFTIIGPTEASYDPVDKLGRLHSLFPDGVTSGEVRLNPTVSSSVAYLAPPAADSTLFTVFGADAPNAFPNWIARQGKVLGGTLAIYKYKARDYVDEPDITLSTPRAGAEMRAIYTKAANDKDLKIADLRFIQMFTDNTGPNGTLVRHIDRQERQPNTDQDPWYYTQKQHEISSNETIMDFQDYPHDPITSIPFNRMVRFEAYLATFDREARIATIHDGWGWGYDIEAVPEPATIIGSAMGLGLGAFFKKKVQGSTRKQKISKS
jgi:hypothetical protein